MCNITSNKTKNKYIAYVMWTTGEHQKLKIDSSIIQGPWVAGESAYMTICTLICSERVQDDVQPSH